MAASNRATASVISHLESKYAGSVNYYARCNCDVRRNGNALSNIPPKRKRLPYRVFESFIQPWLMRQFRKP
jgi:hypothetical protein